MLFPCMFQELPFTKNKHWPLFFGGYNVNIENLVFISTFNLVINLQSDKTHI